MRSFIGLPALALLGACTVPATSSYYREAGSQLDTGTFGNATMNNVLVHSQQRDAMVAVSANFAAAVPTTINFAFDSAQLDGTARTILNQQADFMRQFPEVRFAVYGHTDLVGSRDYNYSLGLRRAQAAVAYLESRGVSRARLEALVSEGETQPIIVTQGRERANRRTVTDVFGFMDGTDGGLNGKYAAIIFREYVASAVPVQGVAETASQNISN